MKIIITEEQYKELSDWDIYSQLSPWSRRRMQYIDIKSSLERHIKRNTKMILDNPIEAAEGLIYKTIWDTVPLVWNVNMEDDEFDKYFHEKKNANILEKMGLKDKYQKFLLENHLPLVQNLLWER
jgi:type III secretory pathway component EscU